MHDDESLDKLYAEGATEEPPAELDARIAAAAKREGARRWMRWYGGMATAAVLVVAVGVSLNLRNSDLPDEPVSAPIASEWERDTQTREVHAAADTERAQLTERSRSPNQQEAASEPAAASPPPQAAPIRDELARHQFEPRPQASLARAERRLTSQLPDQSSRYEAQPHASGFLIRHPECEQPVVVNGAQAAATGPEGVVVTAGEMTLAVSCTDSRWSIEPDGS